MQNVNRIRRATDAREGIESRLRKTKIEIPRDGWMRWRCNARNSGQPSWLRARYEKKRRRETQSHKRAGHGVRAEPPVGLSQSRHGLDYYVSQKSSEKYKWMFDYDVKLWNRVFLQWMC